MGLTSADAWPLSPMRVVEPLPPEVITDDERQVLILHHVACMKACAMGTPERREHWERMRDLINGRSESAIATLEKAKGLR
jgi:hypothetical protein